jgi:short subunit dehydrogenase-like uncharacterized protein
MSNYLIYGANGYTGALIAREAWVLGHRPVLAGRNAAAVAALARELGLEHRTFGLDAPSAVVPSLAGMTAVLNCAGPFSRTAVPLAEACLRARAHYLDVTGEIAVFEALAARDAEALVAGVMLLPGVGFDVVPSDCLAVHLKQRLPSATHLALGFQSPGRMSRGTATTVLENLHRGGAVRHKGVLTPVPAAWKTRAIDFGAGPRRAVTVPWGDVSTAWRSTGIPDIEVYTAASRGQLLLLRASRRLGGLLTSGPVQRFLRWIVRKGPPGPSAEQRARGRSLLWGEVEDGKGGRAVARLSGPEGYTLTARAALACVKRVLAGDAPPGYQTPALAYGPDLVLEVAGVERKDD